MNLGGRMKKGIKVIVVVLLFFCSCYEVSATTLQDLYNDVSALEKSYNAAKKKASMTEAELRNVRANISSIEAQISNTQHEITQAEADIQSSEADIEKKKEETNQMLLYLQLMNSNGDNMLEYIFDADNYTDLIYRYAVVTQMSDYNQGLMDELNALISTLENKKVELARKQTDLSSQKKKLQEQYAIIQVQYKNEQDEGLSIADQISEKKKLIKLYQSRGCSMTQDVNSCTSAAAVDGWTYPLKHFRQTSNYGWDENRYHYAVDLGVAEGNSVYAVANGTVVSAKVGTNGCGGMIIQIRHNYNGSNYISLYMHLIDSYVKMGDVVSGGQVIGTSGGGPIEVAKWGDRCTGGAHLHFTMSAGANLVGYSSQKGSTFDPVRFFPAMKGIGSRL